jgi:hypothetical protein
LPRCFFVLGPMLAMYGGVTNRFAMVEVASLL